PSAKYAGADHRRGDVRGAAGRVHRGGPELYWNRRWLRLVQLGLDDPGRLQCDLRLPVPGDVPGRGDRAADAVLHFRRRRTQGRAGPATPLSSGLPAAPLPFVFDREALQTLLV